MKAKIIEKEKEKKFEPIVVELTIESEEEICALWHRLNVSIQSIEDGNYNSIDSLKYQFEGGNSEFWRIINKKVEQIGLKR